MSDGAILSQQQVARVRARAAERVARGKLDASADTSKTSGWQSVLVPVVGLVIVGLVIVSLVGRSKQEAR